MSTVKSLIDVITPNIGIMINMTIIHYWRHNNYNFIIIKIRDISANEELSGDLGNKQYSLSLSKRGGPTISLILYRARCKSHSFVLTPCHQRCQNEGIVLSFSSPAFPTLYKVIGPIITSMHFVYRKNSSHCSSFTSAAITGARLPVPFFFFCLFRCRNLFSYGLLQRKPNLFCCDHLKWHYSLSDSALYNRNRSLGPICFVRPLFWLLYISWYYVLLLYFLICLNDYMINVIVGGGC